MAVTSTVPTIREPQDEVPRFRRFRNLANVRTDELERAVDRLGKAIVRYRSERPTVDRSALEDGLAEIEAELIYREILRGKAIQFRPSGNVVRISHRGRSGYVVREVQP